MGLFLPRFTGRSGRTSARNDTSVDSARFRSLALSLQPVARSLEPSFPCALCPVFSALCPAPCALSPVSRLTMQAAPASLLPRDRGRSGRRPDARRSHRLPRGAGQSGRGPPPRARGRESAPHSRALRLRPDDIQHVGFVGRGCHGQLLVSERILVPDDRPDDHQLSWILQAGP